MNNTGGFVVVVLILLIIGLGLAGFVASQMDDAERAQAERIYAQAALVRADAERSRAAAESTAILMAVMMPYTALGVASIFGLALIGLIIVLARRPAPTQQQIYILPRGVTRQALPPGSPEEIVIYQLERETVRR